MRFDLGYILNFLIDLGYILNFWFDLDVKYERKSVEDDSTVINVSNWKDDIDINCSGKD